MEQRKIIPLDKRNASFQVWLSLRTNRSKRQREKAFLVEGVKPLNQLLKNHWEIDSLLLREGKPSPWAQRFVQEAQSEKLYQVSAALMAELSGKDEDPELLAVAKLPSRPASALPLADRGVYVVVDRPNSPGNLGSLIRTAEAFGAKAVLTYGHATDFFDPKTISASIGAVFSIPIAHLESGEGFNAWRGLFQQAGISTQVVALDEGGDVDCGKLELKGTGIVVVGNETDGLSKVFRDCCDVKVRIPMTGSATSLNAACSGSILLYELLAR
jgi:tRNA G18 (ribose-2'-O)-methylase SpoU